MRSVRGTAAASVTLDAAGDGTISFGPGRPYSTWLIHRVALTRESVAGPGSTIPQCRLFLDTTSGPVLDSTLLGSSDTFDSDTPLLLHPGQRLYVSWTDGTVSDVLRATVEYTENLR